MHSLTLYRVLYLLSGSPALISHFSEQDFHSTLERPARFLSCPSERLDADGGVSGQGGMSDKPHAVYGETQSGVGDLSLIPPRPLTPCRSMVVDNRDGR